MEQIKRANRLYTNDSIFLKKSLSIPVLSELDKDLFGDGDSDSDEETRDRESACKEAAAQNGADKDSSSADLSPMDYLKRMDGLITQSKQAAAKTCKEEKA